MKKTMLGAVALLSMSAAAEAQTWTGQASYYRAPHEMTCAHRSLPFGTRLRVTNLKNNRTAILTVADRDPSFGDGSSMYRSARPMCWAFAPLASCRSGSRRAHTL